MKLALLLLALAATAARADDFEDLGACKEQAFGATKSPIRTVVYERDAKQRIVKATTTQPGGTSTQTRTYDDKGRLATVAIDGMQIVNEYDPKSGRLARTLEYATKSKTPSRVWTREYDPAGHLVHQSAKEGDKVTIDKVFTYDKAERIATIKMDGGATSESHVYDDKGHLVRNDVVVSGAKIAFSYKYDDQGRRIEQANEHGRIAYSYDCR